MKDQRIKKKLTSSSPMVYLSWRVGDRTAARIREANLPGIFCNKAFGRYYPNGHLASQVMGAAVARYADVAVLTSDNPRHEDPMAIIEDAKPGLHTARQVIIEPDRRRAIGLALAAMRPEDVLVIAGKGHETTQQIGDVKQPFSDAAVVRELTGCA